MSEIITGGPAFPTPDNWRLDSGMTLRDYFAAKAMQSLIAKGEVHTPDIAKAAYLQADAMLKERNL